MILLVSGQVIFAQKERSFRDEIRTIEVSVTRVQIPVSVSRKDNGQPVYGLGPKDFSIFEDKVEQVVISAAEESFPIALNLLIDTSSSMRPSDLPMKLWQGRVRTSIMASYQKQSKLIVALSVVDHLLGYVYPEDMISLTTFAKKPVQVSGFGTTPQEVRYALEHLEVGNSTSLRESIKFVSIKMREYMQDGGKLPARKVLLVLSDGEDNTTPIWKTDSSLLREMRESGLTIYASGIIERDGLLRKLAEDSGGRVVPIMDVNQIFGVVSLVSREMHNKYMVEFNSTMPLDGKYRKVRVRLNGHPEYNVLWKPEYCSCPR